MSLVSWGIHVRSAVAVSLLAVGRIAYIYMYRQSDVQHTYYSLIIGYRQNILAVSDVHAMGRSAEYHLHANVVWWQHRNEPLARVVRGP